MLTGQRNEFFATILGLGDLYRETPSIPVLDLYWASLCRFDLDEIHSAIALHLADTERGRFMPKPADIIDKIPRAKPRESMIAWDEVVRAMRRVGRYRSLDLTDQISMAVVRDMGGWIWLCDQNIDEPWTQREFERRYAVYQKEGIKSDKPLVGLHELDNRSKGLDKWVKDPVTFGEKQLPEKETKRLKGKK